jgi:hypothetical protein
MPNAVRLGGWASLTVATLLAGGLARPADAAPGDEKKKDTKAKAPAASAATVMGMQAYVDPATGRLRQPTREEQQALHDEIAALTNRSVEGLQPVFHADGTIALHLQGRFLNLSVAHIDADGNLSMQCLTAPPALAHAAASTAKQPSRPRTKPEVAHER